MNVELEKNRKPRGSREFVSRGAAVWIPVALFVLLVLFQMVPLPPLVLKHVSPSTYRLYQDVGTLEYKNIEERGNGKGERGQKTEVRGQRSEVGKRQRPEDRGQRSEGQEQGTEVRGRRSEVRGQKTEVKEKDEHRISNIQHPTSNEKMKQRAGREWRCISINRHGTLRMLLKFLAYMGVFFIVLYFDPSGQGSARNRSLWFANKLAPTTTRHVSDKSKEGVVPDFIFGLIWVIFFLGLFNAVFSFLQEVSGGQIQWLRPLAPPGSYLGTFKSPNNFSEFLEMVIPLTMGLLIVQNYAEVKKFSRRLGVKTAKMAALFSKTGLLSFGIIILIPALFFSLCRGGFVTFPVTMVVTLIFMVVSYRLHDRYSFVLFSLVVVGGFGYLIWMGIGPVIEEMMTIFNPGSRPFTYSDAIDIIKDFPIFGVGFGDWHDIIMKYSTIIGRETWMPAIAYNDTLQITAETGFAGLACVARFCS